VSIQAFIPKGKIYAALFSSAATFEARPFVPLGNASAFALSANETEKKLMNFQNAAGGVDAAFRLLESLEGTMDLRWATPANLALLTWGATNALNATAIVGEAGYKIVPNTFVPTKRLINLSVAPVVKKGATVILAADYTASAGGILISPTITTGTVISGDSITIDYTPQLGADVQTFINSAQDYSILVEGINQVDGKNSLIKIWKAKLGTAKKIDGIADDFSTLSASFVPQADTTIVTVGKSQYYEIQQAS
jgi:hypothetical protein